MAAGERDYSEKPFIPGEWINIAKVVPELDYLRVFALRVGYILERKFNLDVFEPIELIRYEHEILLKLLSMGDVTRGTPGSDGDGGPRQL